MFHSISLAATLVLSMSYVQPGAAQTGAAPAPDTSSAYSGTTPSASTGSSGAGSLTAGLSSACQAAAGGLLTSDFGTCANVMGLVSILGAPGSIIAPINSWITGVCSAAPCSNETLTSATQTISSGCGADAQKGSVAAVALMTIVSNYNAAKNLVCTQYVSNSTFCIPSILGNVQTVTGQNITIAEVASILSGGMSPNAQTFANVPPSIYCNDCGHALFTQSAVFANAATPASGSTSNMTATSTKSISGVCGASFADGKVPSTVRIASKDTSKDASQKAKDSAGVRMSVTFSQVACLLLSSTLFFQLL